MRTKLMVVVAAVGLVLAAVPVWAHHAFAAEFDQNKPIKVQGSVTKWELTNPHSWIYLDVKDADGKMVTWMIEGASPNNLYRLGFTKESLPPGTEILVEGYQETQKAFHGKLPELAAQHLRNIGLTDSEQGSGLHLFQAASF